MKKLLLLSVLLIFACSGDDSNDNTSGTTDNSFNPPNWIQGVWMGLPPIDFIGYEFRVDDLCTILNSQATCNKAIIELSENTGQGYQTNVYEEISDTRYFVVFTAINIEQTYEFEKISENEIRHIQTSSTSTILTKQ